MKEIREEIGVRMKKEVKKYIINKKRKKGGISK
jgi:hypothetical protein